MPHCNNPVIWNSEDDSLCWIQRRDEWVNCIDFRPASCMFTWDITIVQNFAMNHQQELISLHTEDELMKGCFLGFFCIVYIIIYDVHGLFPNWWSLSALSTCVHIYMEWDERDNGNLEHNKCQRKRLSTVQRQPLIKGWSPSVMAATAARDNQ